MCSFFCDLLLLKCQETSPQASSNAFEVVLDRDLGYVGHVSKGRIMIFVPLSLLTSLLLTLVLVRFVMDRDLRQPAHRLFALLIGCYAVQSGLVSLRWGYGLLGAGLAAGFVAPLMPVVAYLAFAALGERLAGWRLWPLLLVALNWCVRFVAPLQADGVLLLTYLVFGVLLLAQAFRGTDTLSLSPLRSANRQVLAMGVTGATLMGAALTDVFIFVDFVRNDGANAALAVTLAQTLFGLLVGVAASFGRATGGAEAPQPATKPASATSEDAQIIEDLQRLFETEGLHRDEDLSLRRLARRLGLPDRKVSHAINRSGQSVSQFVNGYRINEACQKLTQSDETVLAISLASGFATKSNFNREFQRVTGMSPSRWRAQGRASDADPPE